MQLRNFILYLIICSILLSCGSTKKIVTKTLAPVKDTLLVSEDSKDSIIVKYFGTNPTVRVSFLGSTQLPQFASKVPANAEPVKNRDNITIAYALNDEGNKTQKLMLKSGNAITVEPYQYTYISPDGNTIVKSGDLNVLEYIPNHNFLFYDSNGNKLRSLIGIPAARSCDISNNGFFSIITSGESNEIKLYSLKDSLLWTRQVGNDNLGLTINISADGYYVAVNYLAGYSKKPNGDLRTDGLIVLDRNGNIVLDKVSSFTNGCFGFSENYLGYFEGCCYYYINDLLNKTSLYLKSTNSYTDRYIISFFVIKSKNLIVANFKDAENNCQHYIRILTLSDNQIISEIKIPGKYCQQPTKLTFKNDDSFMFSIENKEFIFSLN
jgi:hypothetical protein